ncbi:hypothetical protein [Mycolicibacterium sp. P9-64]|uniref:hypothetical protein n=1 Tax=Mycolicibacterium sp. P9-64 TaxID=2024612 RepID=UPI0011EBBF1C|nr:hypothetical protein [Mycolicibacterium sp. P9-64]
MTAPDSQAPRPGKAFVTRRDARNMMRQLSVGIGALLLASVDEWDVYAAGHNAHMRTALTPLARGHHIAATLAASIDVWMSTPGKHPPRHLARKPYAWPEVNCRGKLNLVAHHEEMEPTNDRRSAYRRQDTEFLLFDDDLTLCELTWDYDQLTESAVTHIWVSAPLDEGHVWPPFEVSMAAARAQYEKWVRRGVRWMPIAAPADTPVVVVTPTVGRVHPAPRVAVTGKPVSATEGEQQERETS